MQEQRPEASDGEHQDPKVDLDMLLRTHDPADKRDRMSLARTLGRYSLSYILKQQPDKSVLLPFTDSVAWSRVKQLLRHADFTHAFLGRINEHTPVEIVYYTLSTQPSSEKGVRGYLCVTPEYRAVTLSQEEIALLKQYHF